MNKISDELIPIILSYLNQNEAVFFASLNSDFYRRFMNEFVRQITLQSSGRLYDFLNNEEFRIKIASKMRDPYQQLRFIVPSCHSVAFVKDAIKAAGDRFSPITRINQLDVDCDLLIPFSNEKFDYFDCFEKINHVIIEFKSHHHEISRLSKLFLRISERKIFERHHSSSSFPSFLNHKPDFKNLTHLELRDLLVSVHSLAWIPGLQCVTLRRISGALIFDPLYATQLKSVTLISCPDMADVSAFREVPRVYLEACFKLSDISPLKSNEEVHVIDCWNILDYSQSFHISKKIHLSITNISSYLNLDAFQRVEHLTIQVPNLRSKEFTLHGSLENLRNTIRTVDFSTIRSFSTANPFVEGMEKLRKVKITDCSSITSLSTLKNVSVIILSELSQLKSLRGLEGGRIRVLEVNRCKNLSDFRSIHYIPTVRIYYCAKFNDFNVVQEVKDLRIVKCSQNIANLSTLTQVEALLLHGISPLLPLAELRPLKELSLSWKDPGTIQYIKKFGLLMKHERVTIRNCDKTEFIKACSFLPEMELNFDIIRDEKRRMIIFYQKVNSITNNVK